jgi:hypothetical protein
VGLLRRGVEPSAVIPVAALDCLYRFLMRWARLRTTLDLLTGRETLDRSAAPAAASESAPNEIAGPNQLERQASSRI